MPYRALLLTLFLVLSAFSKPNVVSTPEARVHAVVEKNLSKAHRSTRIGFFFELEPHWHIYWRNPGDSGLPPKVEWLEGSENYRFSEFQWPVPKRIALNTLANYGYENEVLLPMDLEWIGSRITPLRAKLSWLVCKEECIPRDAELMLDPSSSQNSTQIRFPAAPILTLPGTRWLNFRDHGNTFEAVLGAPLATYDPLRLDFFPYETGLFKALPKPSVEIRAIKDGMSQIHFTFDKRTWTPGKVLKELPGLLFLDSNRVYTLGEHEISTTPPHIQEVAASSATGLGWLLLFAMLGGVLLNLMPCVFPILALKAFDFAKRSTESKGEVRLESLLYIAGVLTTFWVLGGILLVLRWQGMHLGWGFQLQSAPFVLGLAVLFLAMAMNFWGHFEIHLRFQGHSLARVQESRFGAFFSGLLTTVVSTPCTAPFLGAALGASLTLSPFASMAIFTAMGLGVALPYALLVNVSSLHRRLPRPGAWMDRLKNVLGFFMMATVLWLLWVLGEQRGLPSMVLAMFGLLVLSIGLWWKGAAKKIILWTCVAIGGALLLSAGTSIEEKLSWETFDASKMQEYQNAEYPTYIDFTASWCLTCQVNKAVALERKEVVEAFSTRKVRLVRADWTERDEAISRALASFGRSSVPTNVILGPKGRTPVILPTVLTPGIVLDALQTRYGGQP